MNILFVHETEYIEKVVFEFQIIPEILSSRGHRVFVIDYPMAWQKKNFFDFGSFKTQYLYHIKKAQKQKGITLIRPGVIKIPILSRFLAFFSYFFLIGKVIKKHKIDRIVLYAAPTNGLQTIYWAKKYHISVHFRLLDVLHQLVPSKFLIFPTYLIEKYIYPRVDELTAITPRLTQYAISLGGNPKTTSYLPTGADADLFYPLSKDKKLMAKFKIKPHDRVVLFAGTLYHFSGLDVLLRYLATHPKEQKNLKFLIIGHGQQEELLKKIIMRHNLSEHVIMTGFIDYLKLNQYINLADVCINPFVINKITNIIFPSKIYQYLSCGKPVIATRLKGLMDLFPDHKNNLYYFNLNRPKEFFNLVHKIKKIKVPNNNLSLQEITHILEKKLSSGHH